MSDDAALDPREAETDDEQEGLTYAEVAAAAITALETVVNMLPDDWGADVMATFEERCEAFKSEGL